MKNRRSKVPLTLLEVMKRGYLQQVRYLINQGVNLDQVDEEKRTALMICSLLEPDIWGVGIARMLIENDADLSRVDKHGLSAFHYACIYERTELVKVFLKALDFDLAAADKQGNTGLHYAVRADNTVIVKLVVQAYVRYKIDLDKTNKRGLTALDEAHRLGRSECAQLLKQQEAHHDSDLLEDNNPLRLDLKDDSDETMSLRSGVISRKRVTRPHSSFVSRRSSQSSVISTDVYSYRRSPTIYSYVPRGSAKRETTWMDRETPANERDQKRLIRCVSLSDFRNNPEYLFHTGDQPPITDGPVSGMKSRPTAGGSAGGRVRAKSAFIRRSEVEGEVPESPMFTWRTEFKKLYTHFQYQCTPSYRVPVLNQHQLDTYFPNLDKPSTPSPSEEGLDEERSKKHRKMWRQNTREQMHGGKGKPPIPSKSRKLGNTSKTGSEVGLESSSESINSSVSSKKVADDKMGKVGGKDKKDDGRTSRTGTYKTIQEQSDTSIDEEQLAESNRLKIIAE